MKGVRYTGERESEGVVPKEGERRGGVECRGKGKKRVDGYQGCLGVKGDRVGPKLLISA